MLVRSKRTPMRVSPRTAIFALSIGSLLVVAPVVALGQGTLRGESLTMDESPPHAGSGGEEFFKVELPSCDADQSPGDETIWIPKGRPVYALFVAGYVGIADFDELYFYNFAKYLMEERNAYVHWSWWNNLLKPYLGGPLHETTYEWGITHCPTRDSSFPGDGLFKERFVDADGKCKALPNEDYQFQADAESLLVAIRRSNPSAQIIIAGHSMGGGAVVRLAANLPEDLIIDIVAPIDPVGNRSEGNGRWTRWRALHPSADDCADGRPAVDWCPWVPFLQNKCQDDRPTVEIPPNIVNLFHRWQNETYFPFDHCEDYRLGHARPGALFTLGTSSQEAVETRGVRWEQCQESLIPPCICCYCNDPTHERNPNGRDPRFPSWLRDPRPGGGRESFQDGHGEIVGFQGVEPKIGEGVEAALLCQPGDVGRFGIWVQHPEKWRNQPDNRKALLLEMESSLGWWDEGPLLPHFCMVSPGLIELARTMNRPPSADAGPDTTIAGTGPTPVVLNGSGSTDPDVTKGDGIVQYEWIVNADTLTTVSPNTTVELGLGTHIVHLTVTDRVGHISADSVQITVGDARAPTAAVLELLEKGANPTSTRAVIAFNLPAATRVTVDVFSIQGRRVRRLVRETLPEGFHSFPWDLRDEGGRPVAAGIYLYRVTSDVGREMGKVTVVR